MYIFIQCWKRAVVSALQSFDITFVVTYLPTVSSLVLPCCPATNISSHTVLGLLNQLQMKEFKQKKLYEGA